MDSRLSIELERVGERLRRLALWRALSIYWLVLTGVSLALVALGGLAAWGPIISTALVVLAAAFGTAVLAVQVRRATADQRRTARRIERQFPDLDNRLLAAIEPAQRGSIAEPGYLQGVVTEEAIRHSRMNAWSETVPEGRLSWARWTHVAALGLLVAAVAVLAFLPAHWVEDGAGPLGWIGLRRSVEFRVAIDPGHTEIERGTDLLVLARFSGRLPSNVHVSYGPAAGNWQRLPLPKSLDDPVFGGRIAEVRTDLSYRVEFDGQQSEEYHVTVFDYPAVERTDAEITFPEYTAIPSTRIEDTRHVSVVEGATVRLICRLNKPVEQAWVTDESDRSIELDFGANSTECQLAIPALKSQRYVIHLVDSEGRTNKLPPEFMVTVLPNRPPELVLAFPGRDTVASPLEELSLEASAWDDFGLQAYGLEYSLGTAPPETVTLGGSAPAKENRSIQHTLFLEALDAKPDQLVSYHLWAEDIGPDGQRRRVRSDMYFAEVRPFEEIYRQGEQPPDAESAEGQQGGGAARQVAQLAELQKQIINATWKLIRQQTGPNLTDSFADDAEVVRQSQETALDQARALHEEARDTASAALLDEVERHMSEALEQLEDATRTPAAAPLSPALSREQAAYQSLLQLRAREHEVVRGRQGQAGSGGANRANRQLQELELDARENRYETQRTAPPQQQQAAREDNQVMNRLRELARRQEHLNQRIQELQSALQEARDEQKQEELRRQLARLREDQQELLRDMDELRNRMDQPENQQRMADARRDLEETRSNVRQASDALQQGQLSQSLTSGTRAQRGLEQLRDEFRQRTANQFADDMREMRDRARQLEERQQAVAEKLDQFKDSPRQSLRDDGRTEMAEELDRQKDRLDELAEQMKSVSEAAETPEPLLSKQLYDTLRDTHQRRVDQNLQMTAELLRRGFVNEADQAEQRVGNDVQQIRRGVERAARSILGDPAESTRRALEEIEDLTRQVEREVAQANPGENQPPRPGPAGSPTDDAANPPREPQPSGSPAAAPSPSDAAESSSGRAQPGAQTRTGQTRTGLRGDPAATPGDERTFDAAGWTGPGGPITGNEFREWSDRLRDVEEMLEDPSLRAEVAGVRERAGAMRAELKRHSKEPNWSLVRSLIADPMVELQTRLREELARLESHDKLVPIDRDPVPQRFAEQVRRYYERLGSGK